MMSAQPTVEDGGCDAHAVLTLCLLRESPLLSEDVIEVVAGVIAVGFVPAFVVEIADQVDTRAPARTPQIPVHELFGQVGGEPRIPAALCFDNDRQRLVVTGAGRVGVDLDVIWTSLLTTTRRSARS
jgi:hypothetical protein